MPDKFPHKEVHYGRGKDDQFCFVCSHYVMGRPPHCRIVQDPIYPEGWCEKFKEQRGAKSGY
jgi:hypothetical protein